jgi:HEAT repeat protein
MMRQSLVLIAMLLFSLVAVPRAQAQVGSALGNNPLLHQGQNRAGTDDPRERADKQSGPRIVKDVKKAMLDADPKVRVAGLTKLRYLQQPEVDDILINGMVDADTRVKIKAIDLLGARQATSAVPTMSQFLFLRSTEPVVRLHLVAALGRIGDARAALPVMQYMQGAEDDRERGTAVFALGEIGDSRALDALTQAAAEDPSPMVRRLSQEAVEKLQGEIPTQHSERLAEKKDADQRFVPTDVKLSKLREFDEKLQEQRGR